MTLQYGKSEYKIVKPAAAAGIPWTGVTFSGGSVVQDPAGIISSSTLGAVSSLTLAAGDPGNIGGGVPDCPILNWTIGTPADWTANSQLIIQIKLTAAANDNYQLYIGAYDGTVGTSRGIYGTIRCDNGATGGALMGTTPSNGNAAASIVASGGDLSVAVNLDGDNSEIRGVLCRSVSNTGPAYGRYENNLNPSSWVGSNLYGFLAVGATAVRAGGTFTGIEVQYLLVPAFT